MSDEGRRLAEERRAARVAALAAALDEFLGREERERVLEIGCGHGHWLVSLAEHSPESRLAGVDLRSRRIRLAERKVERRGLSNVRFFKADAAEALEAWPGDRPIHRVFLLHPDPWPKKRHAKNRLTGPGILDRIADRTIPGGELYFRTDDAPFHEWSRESIRAHPAWEPADLSWPHEAGSFFKDLLGVHGTLTAIRRP
ncbi:MAG: tRNA (guanine(46)-N(7))-methyltransferase TrmB [Puniceicoccaceae bacterium]